MAVLETMVNLCDFRGTFDGKDTDDWKGYFKKAKALSGRGVDGVYLGFEFCENGLRHCNYCALAEVMQSLKGYGMKIAFVVPHLHERMLEDFREIMTGLLQESVISEIVVNDIGTLGMLREELQWQGRVSYGRLFDKSVRDLRLNIRELLPASGRLSDLEQREELQNARANLQIAMEPTVLSGFYRNLAKRYRVDAFETDTLPDGVLETEQWEQEYEVHVHYPRIMMSRAAYCEYDHFQGRKFLLDGSCQGNCRHYGKIFGRKGQRLLYKEGLSVFGLQERMPDESIRGDFRFVYSGGERIC